MKIKNFTFDMEQISTGVADQTLNDFCAQIKIINLTVVPTTSTTKPIRDTRDRIKETVNQILYTLTYEE